MITSKTNSRIKNIQKLLASGKVRREQGCFVAEGERLVADIPENMLVELYVSENWYNSRYVQNETFIRQHNNDQKSFSSANDNSKEGFARQQNNDQKGFAWPDDNSREGFSKKGTGYHITEIISDDVFRHISDTQNPQGVLAIVRCPEYSFEDIISPRGIFEADADMEKKGYQTKSGADMQKTGHHTKSDKILFNKENHAGTGEALQKQWKPAEAGETIYNPESMTGSGGSKETTYYERQTLVILDDIRDPGNMGTIFRTSEAAGAAGIIMSRGCVDVFNPKVVRSTMGSIFRLPFVIVEDLAETIVKIRKNGYTVYATSLEAESFYNDVGYGRKNAVVIGNEANGISKDVLEAADEKIKIPMCGKVESLNAAVSLAILLYNIRN